MKNLFKRKQDFGFGKCGSSNLKMLGETGFRVLFSSAIK
jgi:hypothetical protein